MAFFTPGNSGSSVASAFTIDPTDIIFFDSPLSGGISINVGANKRAEFVRASGTGHGELNLFDDANVLDAKFTAQATSFTLNDFHVGTSTAVGGTDMTVTDGIAIIDGTNPFLLINKTNATAVSTFFEFITNRFRIFHDGGEAFNIDANQDVGIGITIPAPARLNVRGENDLAGTLGLLVENSSGTDILRVQNNGSVVVGTSAADASAVLEVQSTTQGFLPPVMTAVQGSAISSPAEGLIIFVTTTDATFTVIGFYGREGSAWVKL